MRCSWLPATRRIARTVRRSTCALPDGAGPPVTDDTHYKGIGSFEELEAGMFAAVGAKETDGELVAIWVAARSAPEDRPRPEDRPDRNPEDRPDRRPDQAPDPDVQASASPAS